MVELNAVIDRLVNDLDRASPSRHFGLRYALHGASWAALMATCTFALHAIWPGWLRPPMDVSNFAFVIKCALYVAATAVFLRTAYLSYVPFSKAANWRMFSIATLGVLPVGVLLLSPRNALGLGAELEAELDWSVGPCGFFIALTAFAIGLSLRVVARRGSAPDPKRAAAWTFAATASLASLAMEVLCRHESPTHMLIWHFAPFALVVYVGTLFEFRKTNLDF